jgi:hypothetical protein
MPSDVGVLLPVRLETRFKGGDLWLRVVPDEPWFVRDDPRITPAELDALTRYAATPAEPAADGAPADGAPAAWRALAAQVGAARAAYLHRTFVTAGPDGTLAVRTPSPAETRTTAALPRIVGFPTELVVWLSVGGSLHEALRLSVDSTRLLATFADPDQPGDRRWWEDWKEAVDVGVAGVVPLTGLAAPLDAIYVTGLGDGDPADLFSALAAEGRLGLLAPGTPTNSVDAAPAASLATDPATWWENLHASAGDSDADVSRALTGDPARLGPLPGGDRPHRAPASALVTALWPALWGFAAGQVFDVARGPQPARWAAAALFPEGAYPTLRIGPQPYGLLPTTAWSAWKPDDGDPAVEVPLIGALPRLRAGHAGVARARGTVEGKDTQGLLDLLADTPTSGQFRYRLAWPAELWWLATASAGVPTPWPRFAQSWSEKYPLARELGLRPLRRYGARGASRLVSLPLVLPVGVPAEELPELLRGLADAALATPTLFADTAALEAAVLGGHAESLLLRLAVRSLQLLIADLARERAGLASFDPEPFSRGRHEPGRLQCLIAAADPPDPAAPTDAGAQLREAAAALLLLGKSPVGDLERRLRATVDTSTHRVDPWLTAVPQRRLDTLARADTARRRLGAYGWVDAPKPGSPGPTAAGLLHTPSPSSALAAAVLRDRAISDPSPRWDLDITSRTARTANRIAEHVRAGAHLYEALGREVERVVADPRAIDRLRHDYPVRTEHAGRRVCDGLRVLAEETFPVTLATEAQVAAVADLRAAVDAYGDLLVADAVHHLLEGRADIAGRVLDAAAGLSGPPELSLLRTTRRGRGVSSSVVLVLPHLPSPEPPPGPDGLALVSPATTLDPSVAAALAAHAGAASAWDFVISVRETVESPPEHTVTVTLADLNLTPADALALTSTTLARLAAELAAGSAAVGEVTGGSGTDRYERCAAFVGLIGRSPATRRSLSEDRVAQPPGDPVDPELVSRYLATRAICAALAGELRDEVGRLGTDGGFGTADEPRLRRLIAACTAWGIAPDPPGGLGAAPARLAETARLALPQLDARLAAAPDAAATSQLTRVALLDAAAALLSPTGQVGLTAATAAADLPALTRSTGDTGLDGTWLTVVATVRPRLARLEAHQLTAPEPFTPWANRTDDPWQTDPGDGRPLVAAYTSAGLDLAAPSAGGLVAVAAVDQFDEVIPAAEQITGAAFGFDGPAARAQQAILLAVPPVVATPLDHQTVARILVETRELAHARMARPVDLDGQVRGLAPTALLPASGAVAIPLEATE